MRSSLVAGRATLLALALAAAACAQRPEPVPQGRPLPKVEPQKIASFSVEITPPSQGPGGTQVPGRTLWTLTPVGSGGGPTTNPAHTIQLKSTALFDVGAGTDHSCGGTPLTAPVEITNFFPERLANVHFAFTNISDSDRALCTNGLGGSFVRPGDWPAAPFGAVYYVAPAAAPNYASLAGSLRDDGGSAGGVSTQTWSFDYSTGSPAPFTIRGDVYAELYPGKPFPLGFGPSFPDAYIFGGSAEVGENPLHWGVLDRDDAPGGFGDSPLADPRIVTAIRFEVCTVGAGNGCGTVLYTADVASSVTWQNNSEFYHPLPNMAGVQPGDFVVFTLRNLWDPDGNGPATAVAGSLQHSELIQIAGIPVPITPDGTHIPAGDAFSWDEHTPESYFRTPWFLGPSNVGWNRVKWEICASAAVNGVGDCTAPLLRCPYGSATCDNTNNEATFTTDGTTWTYGLPLTPNVITNAGLVEGVTYYWHVHGLYTGRVGVWAPMRSFVFGP